MALGLHITQRLCKRQYYFVFLKGVLVSQLCLCLEVLASGLTNGLAIGRTEYIGIDVAIGFFE